MGGAAESPVVADQELAAPDVSVCAEPGPVEGDADHGFCQPMLGHAARQMRMVMLHAEKPSTRPPRDFLRVARRRVVGMEVMGQAFRRDPEELPVEHHVLPEGPVCLVMIEVPHVMAKDCL